MSYHQVQSRFETSKWMREGLIGTVQYTYHAKLGMKVIHPNEDPRYDTTTTTITHHTMICSS